MTEHRLGHLRDPEDKAKGREFGHLVGLLSDDTLPDAFDLRDVRVVPPPMEQRGNSCLGASGRLCLRIGALLHGQDIHISYTAPYAAARELEIADPHVKELPDEGAFPYRMIQAYEEWGVTAQSSWPDDVDLKLPIPQNILELGALARVTGIYRIYETVEERGLRIRQALYKKRAAVQFGMQVDDAYERGGFGVYRGGGAPLGGHAQALIGYRRSADGKRWEYLVQNSWGITWNDRGCAWLDQAVIYEGYDFSSYEVDPHVVEAT